MFLRSTAGEDEGEDDESRAFRRLTSGEEFTVGAFE